MSKLSLIVTSIVLLSANCCTAIDLNPFNLSMPSFSSESDPPGSPGWWKKNKKKAEFVPGEGYRVEGVPGFFDEQGRPIDSKVAKVIRKDEKESIGLLKDVKFNASVNQIKSQVGLGPDQKVAEQSYREAEELYNNQQYAEAAKKFDQVIARAPGTKYEQDAQFYLAECEFFSDRYSSAIKSYEKHLDEFPNSPHLDQIVKRQFEIARYWEKQQQNDPEWPTTPNFFDDTRPWFDTLGNALKVYDNIRLNDPTGPLADDAIMATGNSYFLRGRFNDADYHYGLLRSEYPRSEHQYEAHILGLECKIRKYQGSDYDGSSLVEAKKLVKQLKIQFAGELDEEERKRLADKSGQLNRMLAERDMKIAKYYDDTEYYRSAKYYYAQVIRSYPNTPIAEQAMARYQELGGKPEIPATKLEWLVNLLPENAERKAMSDVPMIEDSQNPTRIANQPDKEGLDAPDQTILR